MEKCFVAYGRTRRATLGCSSYRSRGLVSRHWTVRAADCRGVQSTARRHMPELLGPYERACAPVGEDDLAPQILSQFRPPPLSHGCTQAVWLGANGPGTGPQFRLSTRGRVGSIRIDALVRPRSDLQGPTPMEWLSRWHKRRRTGRERRRLRHATMRRATWVSATPPSGN